MKRYALLFRETSFIKFIVSISFIYLSQSIVDLSIVWLVYERTQQPLFIALSVFILQLPSLLSAPFLGNFMDRVTTPKAISLASFVKAIIFLLLSILSINISGFSLVLIALLLILNSAVAPLISVGSTVIVKEILNEEQFHTANALLNISFDICYLFGSFLAGVIISYVSHPFIFFLSSLFFVVASIILRLINSNGVTEQRDNILKDKNIIKTFIVTFGYLKFRAKLLSLVLMTSLWNLLIWGAFPIIFPIFVKNVLHGDSAIYGIINGIQSLGIIIGSLIVGGISKNKNSFYLTFMFLIGHCLLIAIFSLQNNLILSLCLLTIAGIISAPVMVYKSTFFQEEIPNHMKGRVFSVIGLLGAITYPIGNFVTAMILNMISDQNVGIILFSYSIILLIASCICLGLLNNKEYQ